MLKSRGIFRNWLSAGLFYILTWLNLRRGCIIVTCSNTTICIDRSLYSLLIRLYSEGAITKFECRNGIIDVELYGYVKCMIRDKEVLYVTPDGIKLKYIDPFTIIETWLYDIHFLGFDLSKWLIVDVGAFVGDTALYYAKRGAFVIALEPVPTHFKFMLENLELNPDLRNHIIPVNAALADRSGFVNMFVSDEVDGGASLYKHGKKMSVRAFTLKDLLEYMESLGVNIDSFKVKVLKMDCKGCEWDIINKEGESLRVFDILKIEYSGYLRGYTVNDLLNKLKPLGYVCRVWAHNEYALKHGLHKHGTVTCVKSS